MVEEAKLEGQAMAGGGGGRVGKAGREGLQTTKWRMVGWTGGTLRMRG